jgi:hypothetical protein
MQFSVFCTWKLAGQRLGIVLIYNNITRQQLLLICENANLTLLNSFLA